MSNFWSDLHDSWSNAWNNYYDNGIIPNIWKGISGQKSADRNADLNLSFQQDRAAIEDQRYEEEREYNRAWAEEEREYSRALQEQLFEREDTAIERQAKQLSNLGINPLSQQLNGLGAGSAVSQPAAPAASTRMAETPQRADTHLPGGVLGSLNQFLGLADTINGVKTGQYQRDALALQNDKQFLENLRMANGLGINYDGLFTRNFDKKHWTDTGITFSRTNDDLPLFDNPSFKAASYSEWRKMRKDSMPNWQYTLDSLGQDDIYDQAEKVLTKGSKLFDRINENFDEDKKLKFNPFGFLLNYLY